MDLFKPVHVERAGHLGNWIVREPVSEAPDNRGPLVLDVYHRYRLPSVGLNPMIQLGPMLERLAVFPAPFEDLPQLALAVECDVVGAQPGFGLEEVDDGWVGMAGRYRRTQKDCAAF